MLRFGKREIHTVFLRFPNLALTKNLSPKAFCRIVRCCRNFERFLRILHVSFTDCSPTKAGKKVSYSHREAGERENLQTADSDSVFFINAFTKSPLFHKKYADATRPHIFFAYIDRPAPQTPLWLGAGYGMHPRPLAARGALRGAVLRLTCSETQGPRPGSSPTFHIAAFTKANTSRSR